MATPFLSEIKLVSFNFPPKGWALCNGQLLPINQNQALFSLLGTTYGGNGQTNFALPNLRGQVPIGFGSGHSLGEAAGSTSATVNIQQLPTHIHNANGVNTPATSSDPTGNFLASGSAAIGSTYTGPNPNNNLTAMYPASVSNAGGSQPHNNMMPYLVLNFIIALQGLFPSQT